MSLRRSAMSESPNTSDYDERIRHMQNPREPIFVQNTPMEPPASNTLGLAGFLTSLVGVALTAGLLCPVGLILSLIAIGRSPRGFAIAGVVIGLLGSCGGCVFFPAIALALAGGIALLSSAAFVVAGGLPAIETIDHLFQVDSAIGTYERQHNAPPSSLADLNLPTDILSDGWGTPLQYQVSGSSPTWNWSLQSAGPNRTLEADDITFRGEVTTQP